MRRLFMVGYSAEHGGVVLSTRKAAKSGSYVLEIDDAVLDQLEAAGRRRPGAAPMATRAGMRSALTPREIQARLRAGQSVDEVAVEAGVGVDWIERFAAPVLAELASAISRASQAVLHTSDVGPSDRPLEESIRLNLAGRGIVLDEGEFQSAWSARHVADSEWCVSFAFRSRGRDVVAEWAFNVQSGALDARNRPGEELGYVGSRPPARPERSRSATRDPLPVPPPAAPPSARPGPAAIEPEPRDRVPEGPGHGDRVPEAAGDADCGPDQPEKASVSKAPRRRRRGELPVADVSVGPPVAGEASTDEPQPRLPMADLPRPVAPSETGHRD